MRLVFLLLSQTAQRLGDVLAMTWSQYDGRRIALRQRKTGALVWVPSDRDLTAALAAAPRRGITILLTSRGLPFKERHFAAIWDRVAAKAGTEGLQRRDLRRTAMVRRAEANCATAVIAAITGHTIKTCETIIDRYLVRTGALARVGFAKRLERERNET